MRRSLLLAVSATVSLLGAAPAAAGVWESVFRGLDLFTTPTGSPTFAAPNGGRINGQRFGRVRVVPNALGDGYRLELDRTFGADASGRPEVFDLGPAELTLNGSVQATRGFTDRFFTIGQGNFNIANLNYNLNFDTGAEDVNVVGRLNATNAFEINPFGFYELTLDVTNDISEIEANGLLVEGGADTDFDVGPIVIEGNVFFDGAIALLSSFGVDTSDLTGIFPASPAEQIAEAIQRDLTSQVQAQVAGLQIESPDLAVARTALDAEHPGSDLLRPSSELALDTGSNDATFSLPEPSMLVLIATGGLLAVVRRR